MKAIFARDIRDGYFAAIKRLVDNAFSDGAQLPFAITVINGDGTVWNATASDGGKTFRLDHHVNGVPMKAAPALQFPIRMTATDASGEYVASVNVMFGGTV
jgi:hypothetical protein